MTPSHDPSALFPALEVIRPTDIIMVPALCQALRAEYQRELVRARAHLAHAAADSSSAPARALSADAVEAACLAAGAQRAVDALGGRVGMLGVGGAAVDAKLLAFLRSVLPCRVSVAYGLSETGGISSNGVLSPNVQVRLLDRPDFGYTAEDKPLPRGEICVKTPVLLREDDWLCSEEEKAAMRARFLPDGFFRTGDIGALAGDGTVIIIDRASALVKMHNGQFLSPDKVESVVLGSPLVRQCVVCMASDGATVIAVCVPAAAASGVDGVDLQKALLADIRRVCAHALLPAHETPHVVVLDAEPWSSAAGTLTASGKLNRRAVVAKHAAAIAAVAADAVAPVAGDGTAGELRSAGDLCSVVCDVAARVLHCDPSVVAADVPFTAQGLDSLMMIRLAAALGDVAGGLAQSGRLAPTAADALSLSFLASASPSSLASAMWMSSSTPASVAAAPCTSPVGVTSASATAGAASTPSAANATHATVHADITSAGGTLTERLHAAIRADVAFVTAASPIPTTVNAAGTRGKSVLITGAAGFLGRFLLQAAAAAFPPPATVYGLVRAASDAVAHERVLSALPAGGGALVATDLARIQGVAGDVTVEDLGLSPAASALMSDVGTVIHAAAAVKFFDAVRGYESLRDTNVRSAKHVLQFCAGTADAPARALHYVSTLSVVDAAAEGLSDAAQLAAACNGSRSFDKTDAYTLTKHLAEALLRSRASARGIPFSCSRPGLITWPTAGGVANADDWLCRLVRSCVQMHLVPLVGQHPGDAPLAGWHTPIRFAPVDFVAASVAHAAVATATASASDASAFVPCLANASLTPAAVLREVEAAVPSLRRVSVHAWSAALRGMMQIPFHPLAHLIASGTGALSLTSPAEVPGAAVTGGEEAWKAALAVYASTLLV